jgi:flagellar hook protein FlgE
VTYNSAGYLQIQSRASGSLSQIASVGGTAVADLFGSGAAVSAAGTAGTDNFNPTDPTTYTSTTSETVYDSSGNSHSLSVYFAKTAEPNVWQTYFALDGQAANINGNTANAGTFQPATLTYTGTGVWTDLTPPAGGTTPNGLGLINVSNGGATSTPTVSITLDLHKTTQTSLGFGVKSLSQDGYSSGTLAGLSVGNDGLIKATYTNGQSSPAGQLALVNFRNPAALQSIGNNQWRETVEAGKQPTSTPGKDGLGTVQAGSVEQSNVDLTAQLVSMITQQRAYQANAQSIKTQDQITQTIVNLR